MRRCVLVLLSLCLATPLYAQTTTAKAQWQQPLVGAQTFADVQAFAATLKIGTSPATTVTLACVNGTPIVCAVPLPYPIGGSPVTVTLSNAWGSMSGTVSGNAPGSLLNLTVTVNVTVGP